MVWAGKIAYWEEVETEPDVIEQRPVEYNYYGNLLKNYKTNQSQDAINQNISVSNQLSVIADSRLMSSFHKIAYVTFMGSKWTVKSVDVQPPRLILSFGDVYNEEGPSDDTK